jgi:hypothetical protein
MMVYQTMRFLGIRTQMLNLENNILMKEANLSILTFWFLYRHTLKIATFLASTCYLRHCYYSCINQRVVYVYFLLFHGVLQIN